MFILNLIRLMNLNTCEWDESQFEVFGIPKNHQGIHFPEIKSCAEDFGVIEMTSEKLEALVGNKIDFAGNGIHITGVVGDQQGATIGIQFSLLIDTFQFF